PFDLSWLEAMGMPRHNPARIFDTQTAAFLLEARGSIAKDSAEQRAPYRYGLKDLLERYLKRTLPKELQTGDWSLPRLSPEQLDYAARDGHATAVLAAGLQGRLAQRNLERAMAFEMATLPAMVELHTSGVLVDQAGWLQQAADVAKLADGLLLD